jgi:hypothetical protein
MPTKLITRSIQFHPEIWKFLQYNAEQRDLSTSNFVRECVEDYLHRNFIKDKFELPSNLNKETLKRLSDKNLLEIAKYMNQVYEMEQKSEE